jgi:hypothetical protein
MVDDRDTRRTNHLLCLIHTRRRPPLVLQTHYGVRVKPVATSITMAEVPPGQGHMLSSANRSRCAQHEGEVAELPAIGETVDRGER